MKISRGRKIFVIAPDTLKYNKLSVTLSNCEWIKNNAPSVEMGALSPLDNMVDRWCKVKRAKYNKSKDMTTYDSLIIIGRTVEIEEFIGSEILNIAIQTIPNKMYYNAKIENDYSIYDWSIV
jgi:hypothetical protein